MTLVFSVLILLTSANAVAGTDSKAISPRVALERLKSANPPLFLDVRSEGEYASGHIPGALNIPHKSIESRVAEVRKELEKSSAAAGDDLQDERAQARGREVVVLCERGGRARIARNVLEEAGLEDLVYLEGHMRVWRRSGYPTQKGAERGSLSASPGAKSRAAD